MSDSIENLVTQTGLLAWHEADQAYIDGFAVLNVPDRSIGARHMTCSTSGPSITANQINGQPALVFSGSNNPLVYTGILLPKHVIVVAAYSDSAFPASGGAGEFAGLLSGKATGNVPILIGSPLTTKFFDNDYELLGDFVYRRRDVQLAENNMQAGMSGGISIFEVSLSIGFSLDGIQVGKDRTFTNRKWKGPWVGQFMWDRILSAAERQGVYEYLAIKYLLWRRVSSGLNVFPFQADWAQPLAKDKRVLASTSVSGAYKARSKGDAKKSIQPQFTSRWIEESDTATTFWDDHYPGTSFIYRDEAFSPARDTEMHFTSALESRSNDFRDVDYGFSAVEA